MFIRFGLRVVVLPVVLLLALTAASPAGATHSAAKGNAFKVASLVADSGTKASHIDPNLVDPWGLAVSASSPWWVANEATNISTLYQGDGTPVALAVSVAGGPTGVVFNSGTQFVPPGSVSHALFLFATLNGTVAAWNASLGTTATTVISTPGAIFMGLAIGTRAGADFLYAADFNQARIDVYNGSFAPAFLPGAFADPTLPAGYAPINIQNMGGTLFVTYAKAGSAPGNGIVDAFDVDGNLLRRVATGGALNQPWGLAVAPAGFGPFGGDLLVGNHGDGKINAYKWTGSIYKRAGVLKKPSGKAIKIPGLWGIGFGNGGSAGPPTTLFFASGPDGGSHGLFGSIRTA